MKYSADNWRSDPGLSYTTEYKRVFAFLPVKCSDSAKLWLTHYYKCYEHWTYNAIMDDEYLHTDFIENITEAEYIVRRLTTGA